MLVYGCRCGAAGGSAGTMADPGRLREARHARLQRAWHSSPADSHTVSRIAAGPIGVMAPLSTRAPDNAQNSCTHLTCQDMRAQTGQRTNLQGHAGANVEVISHVGASSLFARPSMRKSLVATHLERRANLSTLVGIAHWTLSLAGEFPGGCASKHVRAFSWRSLRHCPSAVLPAAHCCRCDA